MDQKIKFEESTVADIAQMRIVRNSVRENVLSTPDLVKNSDYQHYLTNGKGWVCKSDDIIVGFAIVDVNTRNVWALFVLPQFERKGIGKRLHDLMLNWYFTKTNESIWLSTAPGSRAENFYLAAGWKNVGTHGNGEIKFEMSYKEWQKNGTIT